MYLAAKYKVPRSWTDWKNIIALLTSEFFGLVAYILVACVSFCFYHSRGSQNLKFWALVTYYLRIIPNSKERMTAPGLTFWLFSWRSNAGLIECHYAESIYALREWWKIMCKYQVHRNVLAHSCISKLPLSIGLFRAIMFNYL